MRSLTPSEIKDSLLTQGLSGRKVPFRLSNWRWLALTLMNLILVGNFYVFDNPQALETQLVATLGISDTEFNLLYSIISFPSIILPFFGGYLADYFGLRIGLLLFQTLVTVGQCLFTYGAYSSSYGWMLAGRLIYGLGTDAQCVTQSAMASQWFKGREQAFAIALSTTVFGISETIDTFLTPRLQESSGNLYFPALFGVMLCVLSEVITFGIVWMDRENEKREKAWVSSLSQENEEQVKTERIQLKDIKNFKPIFWWLMLNYGISGTIFFGFTNVANDFVGKRFGFDSVDAGNLVSAIYITMIFSGFFFGFLVDKKGKRVKIFTASIFMGICIYILLAFLPQCDNGCYTVLIPLIGFGIFLGSYSSPLYSCLPIVLNEEHVGTGFGLIYVAENIFLTVIPLLIGYIQDETPSNEYGYFWVSVFMIGYSFITLLTAIPIFIEDKKLNYILDRFKPEDQKALENGETESHKSLIGTDGETNLSSNLRRSEDKHKL